MKKCSAIILFLVYCLGATEASQLLKVPFLVLHYMEHAGVKGETTSFTAFLVNHYTGQESEQERKDHSALPLKSVDDCCMNHYVSLEPHELKIECHSPEFSPQVFPLSRHERYIAMRERDIFQPPRG